MRVTELKALARECRLRGYSRMRRSELIELIRINQRPLQSWEPSMGPEDLGPQTTPARAINQLSALWMSTWEPQTMEQGFATEASMDSGPATQTEGPLTKRQLKHWQNKDSKLAKEFKSLEADINNMKYQMDALKDKITKASESAIVRFKRKKIRSMKRDFNKTAEKLAKSEAKLESVEQQVPMDPIQGAPLKLHPPNKNKYIEAKIVELNKKIRSVKNKKNKERLIAKREALKTEALSSELNWKPKFRLIDGAFDGAYRRYRID